MQFAVRTELKKKQILPYNFYDVNVSEIYVDHSFTYYIL